MKTKLLKKIRKRFDWRPVVVKEGVFVRARYVYVEKEKYELIDHELESISTCDNLRQVFEWMISRVLGGNEIFYQGLRKQDRINKAKYNKAKSRLTP